MKKPSLEEQRALVKRWDTLGPELERIRREALRGMPFDAKAVEELLSLGEGYDGPPRFAEGMVEMQRLFMLHPNHPKNRPDNDASS